MSAQNLPFDSSLTKQAQSADLVVAGLEFWRRGGFTVNETIAYELYNNGHAQRSLELMALGHRISIDRGMTYAETIDILADTAAVESLLGEYLEDILAIGLDRYSEAQRKADVVTLFVQSRCDAAWINQQTGDLLFSEAEQIYSFAMGEYRGWKESAPLPTDVEVGKLLLTSNVPSAVPLTGRKSISTSKLAELVIPATKDLTSVVS
jgi:hypothetical protein